MQCERGNGWPVSELLDVSPAIGEARRIHTKEVVREQATIRGSIAVRESLPHLGLEPDEVREEKRAHRAILAIRDSFSSRGPLSPSRRQQAALRLVSYAAQLHAPTGGAPRVQAGYVLIVS
jgi:hypothetical protein